ncbi:MAG: NtaA/DmoA family FMN-dependent monooxygenase [Gemmatimonas sp.]|nr:NtaA/DmoA family FMN-dependent monooxygenase [Gemmatimonas sp.]
MDRARIHRNGPAPGRSHLSPHIRPASAASRLAHPWRAQLKPRTTRERSELSRNSRKFHIGLYGQNPVTHHSLATWMHPQNMPRGYRYNRASVWQYVGQLCERAKFDFMFSADTEGVFEEYRGSIDGAVRYATQVPSYDETILLSFVGAVTDKIGIVSTLSTNGSKPYITARKFATLDHMTGGRAGWNVVTAFHKNQALNLGMDEQFEHDERYDRADEYMDVCYQLWESWDEDAVVMDVEGQMFADPSKVHHIDHAGKYFKCRGPLNVDRCPQGRPLIVQAGQSTRGMQFAARHAELVFAIQPFREGMKKYYSKLKNLMGEEAGRDPDSCKVIFSFQPIVGETERVAQEKAEFHNAMVPVEGGMAYLSGHLGYDLSEFGSDASLEGLKVPGIQGLIDMYLETSEGRAKTLGDVARMHATSVGSPQVVGTPEQIADWMEETMAEVGGDGFMLSPIYVPGAIEDFIDLVMPVLRDRGCVRTEYDGETLRENLLAF